MTGKYIKVKNLNDNTWIVKDNEEKECVARIISSKVVSEQSMKDAVEIMKNIEDNHLEKWLDFFKSEDSYVIIKTYYESISFV